MATYPLILSHSFSYADHLMHNQYVADINNGLMRASSNIVRGQALSAQIVSETMDRNALFLAANISRDISTLTEVLEFSIDKVADGINGLRADFDIAMGKVITQFEMMRAEMQAGFARMTNLLENRRKIEAEEHFRDALEFYKDGCRFTDNPQWFGDALKHLLASVEGFERNPIAHLHIGHIYHYQREYLNFDKALEHYRLSFTYGEADENDHPVAAQGYFFAGWLSAAVFNNFDEAILLTRKAIELDGSLGEAHYHLAKFHGLRGEDMPCIDHLRRAVVDFDRNYCLKASADPDFDSVRASVNELFVFHKDEAKTDLENRLSRIDRTFDPHDATLRKRINDSLREIDVLYSTGTYFAFLDGIQKVPVVVKLLADAKEAYETNYESAITETQEWDSFLVTHIAADPMLEQEAVAKLSSAKLLLQEDNHLRHKEAEMTLAQLWIRLCKYESTVRVGIYAHEYGVSGVAFSPDSRFLLTGGSDGIVRLWNTRSRSAITGFLGNKGDTTNILCIAYSPDDKHIVTGNGDRSICVWDPSSGRVIKRSGDFRHHIDSIAFNPRDSRFLVVGSSTQRSLKLFDVHTGQSVDGFNRGGQHLMCGCVAFSPCGMYIASGNHHTINLCDGKSGNPCLFDGKGHTGWVKSLAFSPDGRHIVSGSRDQTLRLWDALSGKAVRKFDGVGHTGEVNSVAFSPNGRFIVSGSNDSTVRLWDARTGKAVREFDGMGHTDEVNSVAFSHDGQLIASGSKDKTIRFWKYVWITKESHSRLMKEERLEKQNKIEEDRCRREWLCLTCSQPIGFLQKLKRTEYCKKHQGK